MSLLWPEWLRPLWLLAVPLLAWLLWRLWHRERQSGRWQLLLPAAFHQVLLKGGSGRSSKLPWLALGLAWAIRYREADQVSVWHRVDAVETWHWYAGAPISLTLSPPEGAPRTGAMGLSLLQVARESRSGGWLAPDMAVSTYLLSLIGVGQMAGIKLSRRRPTQG